MKVIAAYLLAVLGGNAAPDAADIKHVLGSGQQSHLFLHLLYISFLLPSLIIYSTFLIICCLPVLLVMTLM